MSLIRILNGPNADHLIYLDVLDMPKRMSIKNDLHAPSDVRFRNIGPLQCYHMPVCSTEHYLQSSDPIQRKHSTNNTFPVSVCVLEGKFNLKVVLS